MVAMKSGERGRNRTYNLLIKSQLLCQLSYAPTANGKVRTNFDYSICFFAILWAWLSRREILCHGTNCIFSGADRDRLR